MQATWSQPVAEVVVFSNDFASRRARPSRPWATSTRQAWRMGRNTGCLSFHPTRRTSRPWRRPSLRAPAAVTPRSTRTGVGDVEHRVYHPPQVRRVLGSSLARSVEHRFQQRPLLVGQVTGVRHAVHGADRPCYGSRSRMGHTQSEPAAALTEQHHAEGGAVRAQRTPEAGEHLLLAGEVEARAAAGRSQGADLLGDRQTAADELDDLGVAGIDRGAQLADPLHLGAGDGDGCGGGGGEGVHGVSFAGWWPSDPGKRRTPRGSSGPGRLFAAVAQPAVTDTGSRWP